MPDHCCSAHGAQQKVSLRAHERHGRCYSCSGSERAPRCGSRKRSTHVGRGETPRLRSVQLCLSQGLTVSWAGRETGMPAPPQHTPAQDGAFLSLLIRGAMQTGNICDLRRDYFSCQTARRSVFAFARLRSATGEARRPIFRFRVHIIRMSSALFAPQATAWPTAAACRAPTAGRAGSSAALHAAPAHWRQHALAGDAGVQLRQRAAVAVPPFRAPAQQRRRSSLLTRAAMFDGLSRSLEKAWDSVRKDGKLTAENIKGPLRDIRWAPGTRAGARAPFTEAPSPELQPVRGACHTRGQRRWACTHAG